VSPVVRKARWGLLLLGGWLAYLGLQCIPLPPEFIQLLSPKAHAIRSAAAMALGTDVGAWQTLSLDPHASLIYWLKSLGYVCVFILVLILVNTRTRLERLLQTIVFSGTLQALYGSFMVLSGIEYGFFNPKTSNQGVSTGTFVNRNHFAGYINLCLAAGMGLMIAKLGGEKLYTLRQWIRSIARLLLGEKTRLRIYLIIMVVALVMTHSRMGNSAFFASTLVVGTLGLLLMKNAPRSTVLFLASVIVLDLVIVGTWFGLEKVVDRVEQTAVHATADDVMPGETRDEVDRYALDYARDYRLTGSGGGTFYIVFPAYSNRDAPSYYDHAHDDYLEVLTETGVIGAALAGGLVLLSAGLCLWALRQRSDPLMRGTAFGVGLALSWAAMHSTVDFNLQIPAVAMTFTVFLALAWVAAFLKSVRAH
jgi:putative inorganic carbon (HCO3(-)) transporter